MNEDDKDDLDEDYKLREKQQRKTELLEKPGKRFCKKCCIPKPSRTHHCSQCRTCWMRMDHHCQWINNCVAEQNYKLFFLMIFYASTQVQSLIADSGPSNYGLCELV